MVISTTIWKNKTTITIQIFCYKYAGFWNPVGHLYGHEGLVYLLFIATQHQEQGIAHEKMSINMLHKDRTN